MIVTRHDHTELIDTLLSMPALRFASMPEAGVESGIDGGHWSSWTSSGHTHHLRMSYRARMLLAHSALIRLPDHAVADQPVVSIGLDAYDALLRSCSTFARLSPQRRRMLAGAGRQWGDLALRHADCLDRLAMAYRTRWARALRAAALLLRVLAKEHLYPLAHLSRQGALTMARALLTAALYVAGEAYGQIGYAAANLSRMPEDLTRLLALPVLPSSEDVRPLPTTAIPEIVYWLRAGSPPLRLLAARMAGSAHDPTLLAALRSTTNGSSLLTNRTAQWALDRIDPGGPRAVGGLDRR